MKTLIAILFCVVAKPCAGQGKMLSCPQAADINLMGQMLIKDDCLYTVFTKKSNKDHDFLHKYRIDTVSKRLIFDKEYFKREKQYYQVYNPRLYYGANDSLCVVDYMGCNLYRLQDDGKGKLLKDYLVASNHINVPFPINYYSNCVYYLAPHEYIFLGKRADGPYEILYSKQNNDSLEIKEVAPIYFDKELKSWDINQGNFLYNNSLKRGCYTYWLYPAIQFFDIDTSRVSAKSDTTIIVNHEKEKLYVGADIWEYNPVYFYRSTATNHYIYALYHGCKYTEAMRLNNLSKFYSYIIKLDWNGNIIDKCKIKDYIQDFAVSADDAFMIIFDGRKFLLL